MLANVTWPSLLLDERGRTWWIIVAVVVVEFLILRRSLNTSAPRAFGVTFAINLFSAAVGMIPFISWNSAFPFEHPVKLTPLVWFGLVWGLHIDGSFSISTWSVTILFSALLSTLLEGLLLFTVFYRVATKRCLVWLPIANLASAVLTYVSLEIFWPR